MCDNSSMENILNTSELLTRNIPSDDSNDCVSSTSQSQNENLKKQKKTLKLNSILKKLNISEKELFLRLKKRNTTKGKIKKKLSIVSTKLVGSLHRKAQKKIRRKSEKKDGDDDSDVDVLSDFSEDEVMEDESSSGLKNCDIIESCQDVNNSIKSVNITLSNDIIRLDNDKNSEDVTSSVEDQNSVINYLNDSKSDLNISDEMLKEITNNLQEMFSEDICDETKDSNYENVSNTTDNSTNDLPLVNESVTDSNIDNETSIIQESEDLMDQIETIEDSHDDSIEIIQEFKLPPEKTTEQILQEINEEILNLEKSKINEEPKECIVLEDDDVTIVDDKNLQSEENVILEDENSVSKEENLITESSLKNKNFQDIISTVMKYKENLNSTSKDSSKNPINFVEVVDLTDDIVDQNESSVDSQDSNKRSNKEEDEDDFELKLSGELNDNVTSVENISKKELDSKLIEDKIDNCIEIEESNSVSESIQEIVDDTPKIQEISENEVDKQLEKEESNVIKEVIASDTNLGIQEAAESLHSDTQKEKYEEKVEAEVQEDKIDDHIEIQEDKIDGLSEVQEEKINGYSEIQKADGDVSLVIIEEKNDSNECVEILEDKKDEDVIVEVPKETDDENIAEKTVNESDEQESEHIVIQEENNAANIEVHEEKNDVTIEEQEKTDEVQVEKKNVTVIQETKDVESSEIIEEEREDNVNIKIVEDKKDASIDIVKEKEDFNASIEIEANKEDNVNIEMVEEKKDLDAAIEIVEEKEDLDANIEIEENKDEGKSIDHKETEVSKQEEANTTEDSVKLVNEINNLLAEESSNKDVIKNKDEKIENIVNEVEEVKKDEPLEGIDSLRRLRDDYNDISSDSEDDSSISKEDDESRLQEDITIIESKLEASKEDDDKLKDDITSSSNNDILSIPEEDDGSKGSQKDVPAIESKDDDTLKGSTDEILKISNEDVALKDDEVPRKLNDKDTLLKLNVNDTSKTNDTDISKTNDTDTSRSNDDDDALSISNVDESLKESQELSSKLLEIDKESKSLEDILESKSLDINHEAKIIENDNDLKSPPDVHEPKSLIDGTDESISLEINQELKFTEINHESNSSEINHEVKLSEISHESKSLENNLESKSPEINHVSKPSENNIESIEINHESESTEINHESNISKTIDSKTDHSNSLSDLEQNEISNNLVDTENKTKETCELNKSDKTEIVENVPSENKLENVSNILPETELKSPHQNSQENSSSTNSSPPVVPIAPLEFHTNDDIRNKIKQQLELLRCMKKPVKTNETERRRKSGSLEKTEDTEKKESVTEKNEEKSEEVVIEKLEEEISEKKEDKVKSIKENVLKIPEEEKPAKIRINIRKSKDGENNWMIDSKTNETNDETTKKNQLSCVDIKKLTDPQEGSSSELNKTSTAVTNLNDVLLSNEGDHLIVSVVGGYKSDDDKTSDVESNEITENKSDGNFSITETLLKRDLTYKRINEDMTAIKPTKTNDITKIKGWRTKTFTIPSDLNDKSDSDNEITIEEHPLVDPGITKSVIKEYIDITQPGTSKNVVEEDVPKVEKVNKNSVFVSDMLDDFLTNDAELKISYEIPKLVAEEGVSKPTTEIIEPIVPVSETPKEDNRKKPTKTNELVVKPKTVAEKRKLLEMERKSKLVNSMEQNENTYLKQLEKEDIRNSVVKSIRNNMIKENIPFTKRCWSLANRNEQESCQHVVCNGKRIKISGSTGGDDVVLTESIKRIRKDVEKNENKKIKQQNYMSSRIEYKPGPLSKKHKLIKSTYLINQEYEVKKMPKIKLVIFAKQGKRIPKLAEQYLQICNGITDESGKISDEFAKFAASAVVSKDNKKVTKVEFEIPYANRQNKILLRRIVTKEAKVKPVVKYPLVHVEDEIKDVVSSMLDTIDNQELDKFIIKDDPDLKGRFKDDKFDSKSDVSRSSSPADSMLQTIIKKRNTRKSKTTLELRRLNVQVIEVDVEDEVNDDNKEVCKKSYCRFGCVCKSLSGVGSTMPDHCGREGCMFQCTCTVNMSQQNHHSVTLPPGTDLLSTSTMVRLQDEAVKHLAKEEKKFTQTVIKANNQTIVVGSGTRERQKRVTKLPKKYTDFVNTTDDLLSPTELVTTVTPTPTPPTPSVEQPEPTTPRKTVPIWNSLKTKPKKKTQQKPSGWYVKLEKINIPNVLPWCMVHNLYKCYCGGKGDETKTDIKKPEEDPPKKPVQKPQLTIQKINQKPTTQKVTQKGPQLKNDKAQEAEELCARTRLLNRSLKIKKIEEVDDKKREDTKRSRKSTELQIKPEPEQKPYQTRKKSSVDDSLKERVKIASLIDYTRSYMGLIIPTASWVEKFQKMLNLVNANIRHIRLLQWNCMIERYKTNQIQLWWNNESVKTRNNVVFTENKKRPSICHMNIKLFEKTKLDNFKIPEIVRSILGNKLPGTASKPEETYVILVYYDTDWEARGTIVLNNTSEQCRSQLSHKSLPKTILTIDDLNSESNKDVCFITPIKTKKEEPQSVLKNMNQYATLQPVKRKAQSLPEKPQKISKIDNIGNQLDRNKIKKILLSYLPNDTQIARWFVLKLENDFSVLKISATQFHIKYSHLITAIQMANKNKKTVRIRSHSKSAAYSDSNKFGLYAIPGCNDKIFFGPYGPYEDHGLETYRYLNGKLYNTRTYNMMMGNPERLTSGFWLSNAMLQSGAEPFPQNLTDTTTKPKVEFVDLTENDSDEEDKKPEPQNQTDPLYSLLTADFSKNLSEVTIQRKEEKPEFIDVSNTIKTIHLPLKRGELRSLKRPIEPEVEIINLDDDDKVPKKLCVDTKEKKRQIPQLYPINSIKNIEQKSFGYIEVLKCDEQYSIPVVNDSKYKKKFKDLESTIIWLDKILKIKIFHFPSDLSLSLSISEKQPVDIPKFNEDYLNGCHLVCEHGVFDLLTVTKDVIKSLGYNRSQFLEILKLKCSAFVKKKVQILGNCVGLDAAQVGDSKILEAASQYIKKKEEEEEKLITEKNTLISTQKEMLTKISFLLNGIQSNQYKHNVTKKIKDLLKKTTRDDGNKPIEAQKLPAGTSLKIINGSIVNKSSKLPNVTIKNPNKSVLIPKSKNKKTTPQCKDPPMKIKLKLVNGLSRVPVSKINEVSNGIVTNSPTTSVDKFVTR